MCRKIAVGCSRQADQFSSDIAGRWRCLPLNSALSKPMKGLPSRLLRGELQGCRRNALRITSRSRSAPPSAPLALRDTPLPARVAAFGGSPRLRGAS
jgi:hypothetical protein